MKRMALTIAALAASSSIALADSPTGPPPGRGGPPIERLAADLGLDAGQKAQVQQILEAHRAKMDAMDAELRQQLSGVLNAEQLKKFDEMREQHRRPGPPPGPPPGSQNGQ